MEQHPTQQPDGQQQQHQHQQHQQSSTTASSSPTEHRPLSAEAQRDALVDAERRASEPQPDNFRDEENADKVVEIGDVADRPIRGLDPAETDAAAPNRAAEEQRG